MCYKQNHTHSHTRNPNRTVSSSKFTYHNAKHGDSMDTGNWIYLEINRKRRRVDGINLLIEEKHVNCMYMARMPQECDLKRRWNVNKWSLRNKLVKFLLKKFFEYFHAFDSCKAQLNETALQLNFLATRLFSSFWVGCNIWIWAHKKWPRKGNTRVWYHSRCEMKRMSKQTKTKLKNQKNTKINEEKNEEKPSGPLRQSNSME